MTTVFYSWQMDTPTQIGRKFISTALEEAIDMLNSDAGVEEALRVSLDSDTQGVSGSPPIVETIFGKIDAAAAFVADLTFVGQRLSGKATPNPNVAIEYGYALKTLTHRLVIGVMNEAYGEPTRGSLPFDLGHLRFPITYNCPEGTPDAARRLERKKLAEKLKAALKSMLDTVPKQPADRSLHVALPSPDGGPRFRAPGEQIGVLHDGSMLPRDEVPVVFSSGPAMWLRVMPKFEIDRPLLISRIRDAFFSEGSFVEPLNGEDLMNPHGIRGADGHGFGRVLDGKASMLVYAFVGGEIWSVETTTLQFGHNKVFFSPQSFVKSMAEYAVLLHRLGILGPYRWKAGISGMKGRVLQIAGKHMIFPPGPCLLDQVVDEGEFSGRPEDAAEAMEPFVARAFDAGQLIR